MEKLIKKYKEECDLLSKVPSRLWKIGLIIITIGCLVYGYKIMNYIIACVLFIILGCTLYKICTDIELVDITKKLKLKYKYKEISWNFKVRNEIYNYYDRYQKNWITKYCKKNRLDKIEKLKILREELNKKHTVIKYIDPVIIGTLLVAAWEILLQYMTENIGMWPAFLIAFFLVILISIATGWIIKECKENFEFFHEFDALSGYDRLQELLVEKILKG